MMKAEGLICTEKGAKQVWKNGHTLIRAIVTLHSIQSKKVWQTNYSWPRRLQISMVSWSSFIHNHTMIHSACNGWLHCFPEHYYSLKSSCCYPAVSAMQSESQRILMRKWDLWNKIRPECGPFQQFGPHAAKSAIADLVAATVYRVFFFNWCSPKIHKYGQQLKYQNWCPPKNSKYQQVNDT